MDFKEILKRYHISPLKYDDGSELNEQDYSQLYLILQKYYFAKVECGITRVPQIPDYLKTKVASLKKRSLLDVTLEDIMDILMEFNEEKII